MRRLLFIIPAAASLVLCLATLALWGVAQRWHVSTGEDALRSAYFDKTYEVVAGRSLIVVRWREIIDFAAGERKVFSTDYTGPAGRTFVFARAPDGVGPFGLPWARQGVLAFPYWAAVLVGGVLPALWAFRSAALRRRAHAVGSCRHCGYDLRASPERCPECGAVPGGAPAAA